MSGSIAVFAGRVLVDSGEGMGTGPARVSIEETLLNVPKDLREIEVDASAGTSCYYRLKAGERYVIFADVHDGPPVRYSIGGCTNTFRLQGNGHILDALRNKAQGGPSRLLGSVRRSSDAYSADAPIPGARVVARSSGEEYETLSDGLGRFEIRGMAPARYALEVSKTGFVPDTKFNHRWSGIFTRHKTSDTVERVETQPAGSISIGEKSCEVRDLRMWPHGRITGTVTSVGGQPLPGVTVQAFVIDNKGERGSSPLQSGKTDATGKYLIEPLPGGNYFVGVNAEKYHDTEPYPPTFFVASVSTTAPSQIHVTDGDETAAVNLTLPPERIPATLRVQFAATKGEPFTVTLVLLENLAGIQRWASRTESEPGGVFNVPVYQGEQYVVKAFAFVDHTEKWVYLQGSSRIDISEKQPMVVVFLHPESTIRQ